MLQQILVNTPIWVWAILAFLLYRGLLASVDRTVALRRIFIIPVVMLVLAIQGIASTFGADPVSAPIWLGTLIAGALLSWQWFDADSIRVDTAARAVFQRGSWTPMVLMMGIFCVKYAVGVTLAMSPALKHSPLFVVTVCALYGLFNGIFVGKSLRVVAIYRAESPRTQAMH
jgi:hypothetical protein